MMPASPSTPGLVGLARLVAAADQKESNARMHDRYYQNHEAKHKQDMQEYGKTALAR